MAFSISQEGEEVTSASFSSVSTEQWDSIATTLRSNGGVATIDFLPPSIVELHSQCFATARDALDVAAASTVGEEGEQQNTIKTIGPNDDSAHATGYHRAGSDGGSMSRYNSHREGFVFSDGETFDIELPRTGRNTSGSDDYSFQQRMEQMFASMHDGIATNVLSAIARNLGLAEDKLNWFESDMGPTDASSQWHVKRYVVPTLDELKSNESEGKDEGNDEANEDEFQWLPVHTDPSLISVVLHDVPGKQDGGMGLQYQAPVPPSTVEDENATNDKKLKIWKDVPHHGHAVATVFVGSVLSYITGGLYPGAKHRVLYSNSSQGQRVAATLFVRPRGDAMLAVPPSPLLTEGEWPVRVRNTTFNAWVARVSKNYMKQKKKKGAGSSSDACGKTTSGSTTFATKGTASPSPPPPPMIWSDDYTEITLHDVDPPVTPTQEKYLGGEVSSLNGKIYTIPGHARRVLEIDPTVEPPRFTQIGPELKGEFKWLRGIEIGGAIYGIPCHADSVLKIMPLTGEVITIPWDPAAPGAPPNGLKW